MKKIFSLILVVLLALSVATPVFADEPAGGGWELMGRGGELGISPGTLVVPVRYGYTGGGTRTGGSLASGDVVVWDETSSDGFTISACITSNDTSYAGVLISTIQTADSFPFSRSSRNWGKMAIKGYCLAKAAAGGVTAGELLVPAGLPSGSFVTTTLYDVAAAQLSPLSMDVGVCLKTNASSGLTPVWLK
uniref:Uncharacterized protein n=1 Tax=viral metagenome TaxID=1070528 RepID=A0A6M3KNR1_9ZZZZ